MKVRTRNPDGDKIEMQMSSMIDVVFQLLIFFMLTLKIIEPEGDFDINMPLGTPAAASVTDADLPPFKVRMEADANGNLAMLYFNGNPMGNDGQEFQRLNREIFLAVDSLKAIGPSNVDKQEVEIEPDYRLHYRYIIAAISACSGKMEGGQMTRYISRIKFAPINDQR
ncbi:MAG: biopolymer transporter ExbD [Planctomycetaceae bacterium]